MQHYDVIIIGSGAGGGTLAYSLANWGKRILLLDRGGFLPKSKDNWTPSVVFGEKRYRASETWLDKDDKPLRPNINFFVGGNTKVYGAALFRLRERDFQETIHVDGISPEWPISYKDLSPYYQRAEELYKVHGKAGDDPLEPAREGPFLYPNVSHEPYVGDLARKLLKIGLRPFYLPLGIDLNEKEPHFGNCIRCDTCVGFPCLVDGKSDAEVNAVVPALSSGNIRILCNAKATKIITNSSGTEVTHIEVKIEGETVLFSSDILVVACGAINSAELLLKSANEKYPNGLGNSSGVLGRFYMSHINTTLMAVNTKVKNDTIFQKSLAINDYYYSNKATQYPLGNIQLVGKLKSEIISNYYPIIPKPVLDLICSHSIDWWLMTEDLPDRANQVKVTREGTVKIIQNVRNLRAHNKLIDVFIADLRNCGYSLFFRKSWGVENCSHQLGTVRFGTDPKSSLLDSFCRSHDIKNLFVVDGSFFPSSSAVNPALTIMAQALRVGEWVMNNY